MCDRHISIDSYMCNTQIYIPVCYTHINILISKTVYTCIDFTIRKRIIVYACDSAYIYVTDTSKEALHVRATRMYDSTHTCVTLRYPCVCYSHTRPRMD